MRAISRFRHLMSSTVLIAPRTGQGTYGAPTFGADVAYPAHLSRRRRLVRAPNGQEVVSGQALYLGTAADIQPTARVTLSTGDVGSTESHAIHPTIVSVERRFDQRGPHHVVVFLE